MCDGYDPPLQDDPPNLEDELLCEYVDGTMDPVVRDVFEEYLRANPDIKEHAECLRDTRLLLCHYGCRCHAPRDLHDRLRRQITCDLVNGKVPFHVLLTDRLKGATMTSAVALLLVVGIAGGFSVMQDTGFGSAIVSASILTTGPDRAEPQQSNSTSITFTPAFSPRMSSLGPFPASNSIANISIGKRANVESDTSFTLLLERSRSLP